MARILWKESERFPWLTRLGQWAEAALMRLYWWFMSMLSPQKASDLGARVLGWLGPRSAKHRHVLANLRMACPDQDEAGIQSLAQGVWRNFGAVIAELPHMGRIVDADSEPKSEFICMNEDAAFRARERPCIFISAHIASPYIPAPAIRSLGFPLDLVFSPFTNPFIDRLTRDYLSVLGCGYISKQNALRPMLRALKEGRSVGVLLDVRVEGGELFPLLGEGATTTTAPAYLSIKTGCDIVPVFAERLSGARYRVTTFPALERAPQGCSNEEAIRFVTEKLNQVVGEHIRELPDQWMCTKRRWPKQVMRERGAYPD